MNIFSVIFEIIGTIAFAISGAAAGIKKDMDIFGICMLGMVTAVGGGMIRDVILGITPPFALVNPRFVIISIASSIAVFIAYWIIAPKNENALFEKILLVADSVGLGIFTVRGAETAISVGMNSFVLLLFVGVMTGVGGGVLRDIMTLEKPYIFVRHVYACASAAGGVIFILLLHITTMEISMIIGCTAVIVLRLCAAKFRWNLPKIKLD